MGLPDRLMLPFINRSSAPRKGTVTREVIAKEAVGAEQVDPAAVATLNASSNKFSGKVAFNNVAPATQANDCGSSNTGLTISLLTEVAGAINTDRTKLNEIRKCLRDHGLMA